MTALDVKIAETYDKFREEEQAEDARLAKEAQEARNARLDEFSDALRQVLDPQLLVELGMKVVFYRVSAFSTDEDIQAAFTFEDVPFTIRRRGESNMQPPTWKWIVEAKEPGFNAYFTYVTDPSETETCLLIGLGKIRAIRTEERAKDAQKERDRQAVIDQNNAKAAEARQTHATMIADKRLQHADLEAQVERQIAAAKARLWTWREGCTLTYYGITWNVGGSGDDYAYESGYCLTDRLDGGDGDFGSGYITVYPRNSYDKTRVVKLDVTAHKVVWERFSAASMLDLPGNLCEEVTVNIPGIYYDNFNGERLLVKSDSEAGLRLVIGAQPLKWIRDVVDGA